MSFKSSSLGILVILSGLFVSTGSFACDSSDPNYVCGLRNAEDLVRLGATPWIVASHVRMKDHFGPLDAIRIDTREVLRLYPTPEASVRWDRKRYPDCTAPPERISSHGLNVRPLARGKFRLYAVNHGERESVEIIDITVQGQRLLPAWRGCVRMPQGMGANGVAPLPNDGIAVSGGGVATWHPGQGWRRIEGIDDGNGIEVSRDARWLFVNRYQQLAVVRVPVEGGAIQTVLKSDYHPDNVRWGEDNRLYVAGHLRDDPRMAECHTMKSPICDGGFVIAQIDPETLATKEILRSAGMQGSFGGGTTAMQVGDHFWVGTFWGDRVAILRPDP